MLCTVAADVYNLALFKAPENWVKYKAAMEEYKSKVMAVQTAAESLQGMKRGTGRGQRVRYPLKRYACEVVHVRLLGLGLGFACLPACIAFACVCPSVSKWAHGPMGPSVPKRAHVCMHEGVRTSFACLSFC